MGLGPGAHSFDGDRTRSWNSEGLADWSRSSETLSDRDAAVETLMLGLRTDKGLPEAWLRAHCDPSTLQALMDEGALVPAADQRLRIPEDCFFVSDDIIRTLA